MGGGGLPATPSAAVAPGTAIVAAWTGGERARRPGLAYGEVRVGPGEIAIGVESLPGLSRAQRRLYDQAVAAAGVDPDDVVVVRVTEASVEVDAVDPDDVEWPVRTRRVARTALRPRTGELRA